VTVHNVVLGELIARRGRSYGYELRDQSLEFFKALGYSHTVVYASLAALEKQGLVRVVERDDEPSGRQARSRVYHEPTEEGRRHFRKWMTSTVRKASLREGVHMQLMEAEPEDLPHMIEALVDFEEQCREQLRALMARPLPSSAARVETPGAALVQDGLVAHLQTMMEWAQRSRTTLVNRVDPPSGVPGRRRP
jgi:DNA-binding PadR family transcriptional regulator